MTRRWIAVSLVFASLGVGLLLLVAAFGGGGGGEPKPVPDVVGMRLDVAQDRLEYAGLDWEIAGGGTFGVIASSRWWVCEQEPAAGRTASSVLLVVDRDCGPRLFRAPDVEGVKLDVAKRRLAAKSLGYRIVSLEGRAPRIDSDWTVCDQEPPPGVETAVVTLTVGLTCVERPVPAPPGTVPDVRGERLDEARTTLERARISIDVYTPSGNDPVVASAWTVCDQYSWPEQGYVQLFVSRADCFGDWGTP